MAEVAHLTVVFLILAALTILGVIGTFVTSPVMAIFALVFLAASAFVLFEIRNLL